MVPITNFAEQPGDLIYAHVWWETGGTAHFFMADETTSTSWGLSVSGIYKTATDVGSVTESCEWIEEAPTDPSTGKIDALAEPYYSSTDKTHVYFTDISSLSQNSTVWYHPDPTYNTVYYTRIYEDGISTNPIVSGCGTVDINGNFMTNWYLPN